MKQKLKNQQAGYKHFSVKEREILSIELAKGRTQKEIAARLNRHPSTISREICRNGSFTRKNYLGSHAHKRSVQRKNISHAKDRLKTNEIKDYVIAKLKIGWTPELIAGRIKIDIEGASTNYESIYLYIYKEARHLIKYLPRGHKKRRKRGGSKGKRMCKVPNRVFINERPEIINKRSRVGDWEADTAVSRQSSSILVVLRERKLQLTYVVKANNKSAIEMKKAVINRLKHLPRRMRRSITFDNGTENSLHAEIAEELNLKTYFCHPYHSWEKGSVENTIGLIRRFLPKKTNFSLISDNEIRKIENALNNRPRKSLKYSTPYELLYDCA